MRLLCWISCYYSCIILLLSWSLFKTWKNSHRMDGVYAPHYDVIVVSPRVGMWIIRVQVEDGSGSSMLFSNCVKNMKLPQKLMETPNEVFRIDGHKSHPIGCITLDIALMGKVMSIDSLLMVCQAPYNSILGTDSTPPIGVVAMAGSQCIKFPHNGRIAKVRSN